jgi:hypothetical protein
LDFKLYIVDRQGHVRRRIDLPRLTTEEEAIQGVRDHMEPGNGAELWQGSRVIGKWASDGTPQA